MRVRHRIPSIFNLSMVDVLCCALGCVILIWLINLRDSKQHQEEAALLLDQQKGRIAELEDMRDALKQQTADQAGAVQRLEARLQVETARADALQARLRTSGKELDVARAGAADLSRQLAGVRGDLSKVQDQYTADEKRLLALGNDLTVRTKDLDDVKRSLVAAEADARKNAGGLSDANKALADLTAANTKLKADLDARIQDARNEATRHASDLADANKKSADLLAVKGKLEADLEDRKKEVALLQTRFSADEDRVAALTRARDDARDEAVRVKTAADNRFAGITLTGKRVVFLVDMSGSMDYVDDNTKAPEKWLGVRTAVVKIMRSLPELEKFQLITFSDKSHYPLGGEGKWLDYDPKTTPDLVFKTLASITPEGGTNMYVPMQSAFAMRAQGLDTVYLCSDGLPNLGEGVTPQEVQTLSEDERGAKLGQFIRNKLKTDWNRDVAGQSRVHIHTVGFFYESPDVGAFLWALARENDGGFVGMSKP